MTTNGEMWYIYFLGFFNYTNLYLDLAYNQLCHHYRIIQQQPQYYPMLKRRTDAESECTEDRRDGRIGAMEYAEGNGTWRRGGKAEHIT